jgi:hypothetical protein
MSIRREKGKWLGRSHVGDLYSPLGDNTIKNINK